MAGGQERVLRRRIKSIQSTQKITRAQELIAASRIVRAQGRVHAAQPYSDSITGVVADLARGGGGLSSALLVPRPEVRRVAHIVVAADRGLCGAYNSNVLRTAEAAIAEDLAAGREYSLITTGRKAEAYFRYREYTIDASFSGFSDAPTYEDARAVGRAAAQAFLAGETDLVEIIYTRFVSAGVQVVERQTLVPMVPPEVAADGAGGASAAGVAASYEFEPSPDTILDLLLPRYVESRVFAALLNASASEHASRQRAMKSATDNAGDLIISLSRVMNRARQDSITTEIMEIVSGAEALRSKKMKLVSDDFLADDIEGRRQDLFEARAQSNS
ncbi:MAG TPA: F0F1 ATP synthase subunit gamma [Acidimicrobiia bacterium]